MNMKKHLGLACMAHAFFTAGTSMAADWNRAGGDIGDWSVIGNWNGGVPNAVAATARWKNNNALKNVDLVGGNPPTIGYFYGAANNTTVTLSGGTLNFDETFDPEHGAYIAPNSHGSGASAKITFNNALSVYNGNGNMRAGGDDGWGTVAGTVVFANSGNSWNKTFINNSVTVQLGIAGALPSGTVVTLGNSTANTGRWGALDLNGNNQTVAGLQVASGNAAGLNNTVTSTAAAVLTVNNSSDYTFAGTLAGAGLGLTKSGSGVLTLTGANTYGGHTIVGQGTLKLGVGALANTPSITIASGATFDVSALASFTFTGSSPVQTLAGGSSSGVSSVNAGGNTLTLASGALAKFEANGTGGTVGKISVTGNLTLNANAITINVTGSALAAGTYRLLDCTGTLANTGTFGKPTITGTPLNGATASISVTAGAAGYIDLVISSGMVFMVL